LCAPHGRKHRGAPFSEIYRFTVFKQWMHSAVPQFAATPGAKQTLNNVPTRAGSGALERLARIAPGLRALVHYRRQDLRDDLAVGLGSFAVLLVSPRPRSGGRSVRSGSCGSGIDVSHAGPEWPHLPTLREAVRAFQHGTNNEASPPAESMGADN
jgi:hypothetical protein